ncbi:hypothetical protein ES705_40088 [subsurface metagenome]
MDFDEYEKYTGITRFKKLFEKANPSTKKGKYNRSSQNNSKPKSISANLSLMFPQQNNSNGSFVDIYSKKFGLSRRSLFRYVRIGDAILKNKFDDKTIMAIKNRAISQSQLLEVLRKTENREIVKNKLLQNQTVTEKSLNYLKNKRPDKEKHHKVSNEEQIRDPEIKEFASAKKKRQKDQSHQKTNTEKTKEEINQFVSEINRNTLQNFIGKGEKFKDNNNMNSKSLAEEKEDKCRFCSKATVLAFGYEYNCEMCGHRGDLYISRVICDDDFANGNRKLRNPELKCENFLI